ncbi:MAG: hypothetical protein NZM17_09640 [Pyrinomonadaceae bacterium]|nr:hypothetical protein [Pyrinomonadaceae bacterium]
MRLARKAFLLITLSMLALSVSAQTPRSEDDPRNTAPTVGTGGPVGGPTGLFTVYDGQTLRRGEYTFSAAYSNFDRDPGNADFTEVPISFQIGLNDYLELFFNTDAYRGVKINSPRNLSGFYLPNSRIRIGTALVSPPAIILAPQGPGTSQFPNQSIFRPQNNQPFVQYPYIGGSAGGFGLFPPPPGPIFGFPAGTFPTLGPPRPGSGNGADLFPGIGAPVGGILPGLVLSTVCTVTTGCNDFTQAPVAFTTAPSYLPDAPFINRTYGESSFSTFTVGGKWRWTGPTNPVGVGIVAYYRFYADKATDFGGWNQLQRGASPGGNRGDVGVVLFADARLRKWLNVSANLGYNYNSSVKGDFGGTKFTVLDRPDELIAAVGVDFPVNRYFQPILEFRALKYVGGRTPNAFEQDPIDGIAGARFYPARWLSLGAAVRYNFNQQDAGFIRDSVSTFAVNLAGRAQTAPLVTTFRGQIPGFVPSNDAFGFILQGTIGRRNKRGATPPLNQAPDVTNVEISRSVVTLPCPPGFRPREGQTGCGEQTVSVRTTAVDPENDVLTYNYTVSGGRIVGQGANVTWDLTGVRPGTYTITVGVDDGCGVCGKTQTRTVEVRECECERVCECPSSITVSGGGVVRPGEIMTFTANVVGGTQETVTYNWTVSQGRIISGQGTSVIRVSTEGLERTNITARVTIGGLCENCPNTAEETGSVTEKPGISPFDEFGPAPNDDVRGRLDNFFVALGNDPTATGYIVIDGPKREADRREALIRNHIRFRKFPAQRITIVRGDTTARTVYTKLYVIPAGRSVTEITR